MRRTCLNMIYELAKSDPRVVFIGSDLGSGTLDNMKAEMPDRFFMEGISEQNLIGVAAGMALEGYIPYVNTIATFITRRCFEQIAIDICLHNLPVRLIGNGGGLVYAPLGPTHTAIEDLAIMRSLPHIAIVSPSDADEMRRLMTISADYSGPIYIRLAKGGDTIISKDMHGFEIGKAIRMRKGNDIAFISTSVMTQRCLAAADILEKEGLTCSVIHLHTVKPIDQEAIIEVAKNTRIIFTVEEHVSNGGLGSAVVDSLMEARSTSIPPIRRLALPNAFPTNYGSQDELLQLYGLQPESIADSVRSQI